MCSKLLACVFRFNVLSLVYLLFLLLLPWFPGPTPRSAGALLGTSILFLLAHFVFQVCLYTLPILDQLLGPSCSTWEVLARHIGVTRLDLSDIPNSVRLVAPDVGILLVSSLCLCLCRHLVPKASAVARSRRLESAGPLERVRANPAAIGSTLPATSSLPGGEEQDVERHGGTADADTPLSIRLRVTAHWLLWLAGNGLAILLLALAGITLPSASSSVYYLLFVGLCTWWACHLPASRLAFDTLCILVGVYAGGHLLCLYAYQAPFVQGVFPPPTIWARVFGFKDIILYRNCSQPNALVLNTNHPWPVYANPGIVLLLYYTVVTLVKLRRLDARRTTAPAQPPARSPERELVELESWPKDTDGVAEDTKPMLSPSTGKPGIGAENCTVHIMGNSPQPGKPIPIASPSPRPGHSPGGSSRSLSSRPGRRRSERLALHTLGKVIMKQSYVCALIAMMSWLTFVLLLWSCLIWIVRSRHHFAMLCSPFLLLYGIALCSLQYVWGMDLAPELPTHVGFMSLKQLGLEHPAYPCLDLGAKLMFTLTFWLLLRDFVKQKLLTRRCPATPLLEVTVSEAEPSRQRDILKALGVLVQNFYAKYWICVCAGMFIVVSFAGRLVVYKIVYMLLFLLCLTLFQVYYSLWRKVLKAFWWLVVAYTMLVLITIYTFQFEDFPMYWRNLTGFTDEQLGDLGLEQFSVSELFSSTLIPGFFLLACILQLHYFHHPFMRITDLEHIPAATASPCHIPRPEELHGSRLLRDAAAAESAETGDSDTASEVPTKWGLVLERLIVLGWTFSDTLTRGQVFVRRLLELHILKLVALYTIWVALQEVSLMNFLLVLLWTFAMPYCRFRHMASCLSTVWTCIIIICKMLYQLRMVDPNEYSSNCTQPQFNNTNLNLEEMGNSTLYRGPVDPANWFGIRKGFPSLAYIQNHLLVLLLLVLEAVVYRRQEYYRKQHQLVAPITETVFEDISREHLDHGLDSCAKYFLNYFYYKFGLEICFLMTVNVIGQRMNFMVILHGCWLVVILTRRRRAAIAHLWPKYCLFLVIFFLYQYLLCVGMPPALCLDYPWRWSRNLPINSALIKWLYLPDFFIPPKSTNLINDFVLLLCVAQQWRVFEAERTEEWLQAAGENSDRLDLERDPHNPTPNFIHCRSYLDMAKVVVFRYLFWFVLVVVFIAGANRISLFGLGYLLASFYLLLFGTAMLRKPARARLVLWDCLILYNITVIISKNMLSLLSCVFVQQMQSDFCWVIQLFSLVCTVKGYYNPKEMAKDEDCSLPVEEAGVIWDSICFFFLLLQRRIFLSYYFLHVMLDLQACALQASRGVALFKASILKSMYFHRLAEKKSLAQLKRQMERIRAKQEKYHQERLPRSTGEGQDEGSPVLHSGEYFLFESDSEEEEEAAVMEELRPGRQSAFQLAYQAWVTNTRTVLQQQPESPGAEVAAETMSYHLFPGRGGLNLAGDSGRREELEAPEEAEGQEEEEEEGSEEAEGQEEEEEEGSEHVEVEEKEEVEEKKEEEEENKEEEEEAKQSHAQRKLKAFGLRVKLFFITMAQNVYQPVRGFFWDILHTQHRAATDVYAFMFLADVVDFIIIIFGFWAFGKHSAATDITSSLSDNQVPQAFLVMLLIQFTTMVIDRALYLRKTVLGKLIFQVILVFGIHLWMFFILPAVTERLFSLNTVAQLWYFVKCIYFSLSAYQIRCGYPTRILGNFLTKKYNHLNLFLFQGFRLVPFLVELRAVMDWVWTDTTLSLSNWMCVEDIYANIFIIKCSRETEKPKGQKKKKIVKYGMGGLIILFLVAIIWFPLLFMSLVRSVVGVVNHPIDVTVTLKLGGYEVAMQFITLYGYEDIVTARIEGSSGSLWSISPPSREQMQRELQNGTSDITLRLTWTFQRDLGKGGTVEHTYDKHTTDLQPGARQRVELAQLLQGTRSTPVRVPNLFPKYIRAPNGPEATPVKQLLPDGEDSYLDVEVQLKRERAGAGRGSDSFLEWWVVRLKEPPSRDGNILPMVIFNDKVSPPSLGFLAGYGIMGLYVSIVLVIGKFVRGFFSEISHSIMFEELPCVDRILKLCQDIFLVRETGELELEEELYAKLIFLYRSPETMIKWTREKE
ncbi:piezo-type mechanosensitive ion channel component 1 [Limosa lapponica baueri]|uniref:Piezo-type mechanosensitive ion channel component 1 n=1 Tax=Limosa lapponica baueri TaxID=1758121 RepID=A0A2I0THS1_LIMLA|nr:piezo-type mechanosensitive ion channel component 1 [Limosa lapponica baueri]